MGNNKKKGNKSFGKSKSIESVSILTPTVLKRKDCLPVLAECIAKQTMYSNIKEWVLITADKPWDKEDFHAHVESMRSIIPGITIKDFYVNEESAKENGWDLVEDYEAIGYLRNVTNWICTGDYMVCMDDDDYYPPTRVEHAVNLLKNSSKMIAGCSGHYMYDADIEWVFQFKKLSENHSVNNAIAYKKEYLQTGAKYDSTKKHAEESSFLRLYQTPMIQLKPIHTVLQMIHINNTYNKRQLLVTAAWAPKEQSNIHVLSKKYKDYIPKHILDSYRKALKYSNTPEYSEYDIVYYAGWGSVAWTPYGTKLGGSEQAIKHLVESWVKQGKKVAVYGDFDDEVEKKTKDDISQGDYISFKKFRISDKYKVIIMWRNYGSRPLLSWPIKADKIFLDIHDIVPLPESTVDNLDKVTAVVVRSKFHAMMMNTHHKTSEIYKKIISIPNGVRVSEFTPDGSIERDPYRFVWCSCYTRGLAQILQVMWPIIKHNEPRASFHVYYGMDGVRDEKFKETMRQLLNQPGVTDHGRQSIDVITKEKQTASYHLYYSSTKAETDCISIRESTVAGCIPILSKKYVFTERTGIHLDGDPNNKDDLVSAASYIVKLLKDESYSIEESRQKMIGKEVTWEEISEKWPIDKDIERPESQKESQ
tara:strand:- start:3821 stop:5761 length:1941 start_codon:yes stop_codon:yes gene_type:complete